jgi:Phytoene/squalene synthetase
VEKRLSESYAFCRELARVNGKSFYFASHALPPGRRRATYALYAFCRTADDLVDRAIAGTADQIEADLADMRAGLAGIYAGKAPDGGLWPALADAIQRYRIPPHPFFDLLDGVAMDLSRTRYESYDELQVYCYKVASVVGLMMCYVFGYRDVRALPYAEKMGLAMQLTNILRDVAEDLRMGRIYLPTEELEAFGLSEQDLREGNLDGRFQDLMRFQIARARQLYAEAHAGIAMLSPLSRLTAHLMGRVYAGILTAIEQAGYDVFRGRAYLTTADKLRLSMRCVVVDLMPRPMASDPPLFAEERVPTP